MQVFRWPEEQAQDFAGGIVDPTHQAAGGLVLSEPPVVASIDLNQASSSRNSDSPLSVSWRSTPTLRRQALLAPQLPEGLATDRDTFDLLDLLRSVAVVEVHVLLAGQHPKPFPISRIEPLRRRLVSQSMDQAAHAFELELRL
jgi:hypothetical protein